MRRPLLTAAVLTGCLLFPACQSAGPVSGAATEIVVTLAEPPA